MCMRACVSSSNNLRAKAETMNPVPYIHRVQGFWFRPKPSTHTGHERFQVTV
jgi:hypothetical protein